MVTGNKTAMMIWRYGKKTFDVVFSDSNERSENVSDQFYDQVMEELIKEGYLIVCHSSKK
jgi:spermidine synthase